MYNLIKKLRSIIIIGFVFFLLAQIFGFLWKSLPYIIGFIVIMKILSLIKFKKIDKKDTSKKENKDNVIDAEYEDVD